MNGHSSKQKNQRQRESTPKTKTKSEEEGFYKEKNSEKTKGKEEGSSQDRLHSSTDKTDQSACGRRSQSADNSGLHGCVKEDAFSEDCGGTRRASCEGISSGTSERQRQNNEEVLREGDGGQGRHDHADLLSEGTLRTEREGQQRGRSRRQGSGDQGNARSNERRPDRVSKKVRQGPVFWQEAPFPIFQTNAEKIFGR